MSRVRVHQRRALAAPDEGTASGTLAVIGSKCGLDAVLQRLLNDIWNGVLADAAPFATHPLDDA